MFLTKTISRLMARSYKGVGLRVRNDGEGYSVWGATWAVHFLHGAMPKETMGDLIKLVGEMPAKGEQYVADKEGNQYEIYSETDMNAFLAVQAAQQHGRLVKVTRVRVLTEHGSELSVIQEPEGDIQTVPAAEVSMVQPGLINADDDETLPEGPYELLGELCEGLPVFGVGWINNRMAFCAARYKVPQEDPLNDLLGKLENIDLV